MLGKIRAHGDNRYCPTENIKSGVMLISANKPLFLHEEISVLLAVEDKKQQKN